MEARCSKTEEIWCSSSHCQHQILVTPFSVVYAKITLVRYVRDPGIHVDYDVSMQPLVAKTLSNCFAVLCRIRSILRSVTSQAGRLLQSLVVSLVLTRLDYGSATLAGMSRQLLHTLRSFMNAADWFSLSGSTIMSLRLCAIFIGCMHRRNRIPSGGAGAPLSTWNGSIVPIIGAPACV